jgi:hypothetical protein
VSSIFSDLGVDPENVSWRDLVLCKNVPTEKFYSEYEQDPEVAKRCLSEQYRQAGQGEKSSQD